MKEHPIIFSAPMVRAILEGRKSQTRRLLKPQPGPLGGKLQIAAQSCIDATPGTRFWRDYTEKGGISAGRILRYQPGDVLWVREAFRLRADQDGKPPSQDWWKKSAWYEADGPITPSGCPGGAGKLRSPRHMPRWASRITLRVTEVRVQRLQEITHADAIAEGCSALREFDLGREDVTPPREQFHDLWDSVHGAGAWARNPWVVAISFERVVSETVSDPSAANRRGPSLAAAPQS